MLQPGLREIKAIIELSIKSPEMFRIVGEWIQSSLIDQALSLSDINGDENTNIAKGRVKEIKQFDMFFNHANTVSNSMENNINNTINTTDVIS